MQSKEIALTEDESGEVGTRGWEGYGMQKEVGRGGGKLMSKQYSIVQ